MLSAIISTYESERTLVPTLAALVPGATAGLLREVIVADAGSKDATAQVADMAGCRFISFDKPLGARLKAAAEITRTPWLLFLRAGTVPEPAWIDAATHFIETAEQRDAACAAVFRRTGKTQSGLSEALSLFRDLFSRSRVQPEQGLLIARNFYDQIGGHDDDATPEDTLLRKLGRRRIVTLGVGSSRRTSYE